jgi:hypothetical protein
VKLKLSLSLLVALALFPPAVSAGPERGIPGATAQEVEGEALVEENCLFCHDDSYIVSLNLEREEWNGILDLMLGMGMPPLDPEVQEKILDYLEANHGPPEPSGSSGDTPAGGTGSAAGSRELPWAYPLYRPNPLFWRER